MDEWTDGAKIALDLIIGCAFIVILLVIMTLGRTLARQVDQSRIASAEVAAYRVEMAYQDETNIMPQDVINKIIETQGNPAVVVSRHNGTVIATWNAYSRPYIDSAGTSRTLSADVSKGFSATQVSAYVNKYKTFTCKLYYDNAHDLAVYWFTEN